MNYPQLSVGYKPAITLCSSLCTLTVVISRKMFSFNSQSVFVSYRRIFLLKRKKTYKE